MNPLIFLARSRLILSGSLVLSVVLLVVVNEQERASPSLLISAMVLASATSLALWANARRLQQAGAAVERQQTELKLLFDLMPAMVWFKDTQNGLLRINRRAAQSAGKSIEEMEGRQMEELYPLQAAGYLADDLEVIHSKSPKLGILETISDANGNTLWIETDKVPYCDPQGNVIGIVVLAQDITERRENEEVTRLLEMAVTQSKESILVTDAELEEPGPRILFVNPAFTKMTGYTAEEALGKTPRILQGPGTDRAVLARLKDELRRGLSFEGEAINYRKDGQEFVVEWQVVPLRDGSGKTTHYLALERDITSRKRLESQMLQSQKLETVGKLAGGVAHEFNSILTAIMGHSQLLLDELNPESPLRENASEILLAAERAADLTRQLLAYGGKQILRPQLLDLDRVLSGLVGTLKHLMGPASEVRMICNPGLKAIQADPGQIEQILVNLAMNAADAMPEGGTLTLETDLVTLDQDFAADLVAGEFVRLTVGDTGIGLSQEVQARAFEPFYTTKEVGEGIGLGLSTCYGIVKQSGGHISVSSELGRGATFQVYFPQVRGEAPSGRPNRPEIRGGTETILLVEADPALRELAHTLLTRLGYQVYTAATGAEALLGTKQVDLLFTEMVMQPMNGQDLAQRILAQSPRTRVLFTSTYSGKALTGLQLLHKPYTPSALAEKLREVLDRP